MAGTDMAQSFDDEAMNADIGSVINTMQQQVWEWVKIKGWDNPGPTFGEAIALLHSEASEALEAFRVYGASGYYDDHGVSTYVDVDSSTPYEGCKPEGVPSEFADILIRLLHFSAIWGIDLGAEYVAKMKYNHTRAYRHGGRAL